VNPEVSKSPQAFRDLDDIAAYIGLDNPQAALRFLDSLENRFHLLAASPGIVSVRPTAWLLGLVAISNERLAYLSGRVHPKDEAVLHRRNCLDAGGGVNHRDG
jgi:plasmid stabilization system protein ParE